jgi:hypothetical protein
MMARLFRKAKSGRIAAPFCLPTQTQPIDQRFVPAEINGLKVPKQASALADELKQPSAGVMIFFVGLEMLGQIYDPLR